MRSATITGTTKGILKNRTVGAKTSKMTVEINEKVLKRLEKRIAGNKKGSKSLLTEQALVSLLDTLDTMEALTNG
jgi:hypothetical protein